jgi:N-acetylglucosamine kinase-like BadF-type ATPase
VDAGGTRTRAVVAGRNLAPVGRGASGPANAATSPLPLVIASLTEAIDDACEAARVDAREAAALLAGVAGIGAARASARVSEALAKRYPGPRVHVTGDAEIALAGASHEGVHAPGIVVIAGTGTVTIGRTADGDTERAGGWGPLVGDEGSAYAVARRALAAVAADVDGRGEPTLMKGLLLEDEGTGSVRDLMASLTVAGASASDVAAYFPLVVEAARRGDEVARRLLRDAGEELGRAAASVAQRLGLVRSSFRVACVGGVFVAGELVIHALQERVHRAAPHAVIGPAAYPPELGAVRLAIASADAAA